MWLACPWGWRWNQPEIRFWYILKKHQTCVKKALGELQRKINTQKQECDEKLEVERETRMKELEELKELYAVCEGENCVI